MKLIIETIFVGVYTTIIYLLLLLFTKNISISIILLLFLLGFFKHFFGFYLGIHNYYCNNGKACNHILQKNIKYNSKSKLLFIESILEGIWFIIAGLFSFSLFNALKNKNNQVIIIFGLASFTHILSEYFGIHNYFCKHNCISY